MKVPRKYRKYWWVPLVLVPIAVALIEIIPDLITAKNSVGRELTYSGTVIDASTQQPLEGAKIKLEAQGIPPFVTYSDSEGFFTFRFEVSGANVQGRLKVEIEGYETYDRLVVIPQTPKHEDIRLRADALTGPPAQEPTPTAETPLPSPTPPDICSIYKVEFLRNENELLTGNRLELRTDETVNLSARVTSTPGCSVSAKWSGARGHTEEIDRQSSDTVLGDKQFSEVQATHTAPDEAGQYIISVVITVRSERTAQIYSQTERITVEVVR